VRPRYRGDVSYNRTAVRVRRVASSQVWTLGEASAFLYGEFQAHAFAACTMLPEWGIYIALQPRTTEIARLESWGSVRGPFWRVLKSNRDASLQPAVRSD
jgi:hypothetical protein